MVFRGCVNSGAWAPPNREGAEVAKIDFGKLARDAASSASTLVHPRDLFNALPAKAPGYDYLRGPQDQILAQWHERRVTRDLVIKMNTGGGKTIVGLLIARSCLNDEAGPVAYLAPDHYLADQVRAEADRLGIETTDDPRSWAYSSGKAVLVDVFQRLFNGKSIFGVTGSAGRAPVAAVGAVIIDDAHACVAKAEQAFRLTVPSGEGAYGEILDLFGDVLGQQSPTGLLDLRAGRSTAVQQIPYWAWVDRQQQVLAVLHPLGDQKPYLFAWPLLVDVLPVCRGVLTSDALEIAAPCLPVSAVTGFQQAQRRVYLTATLADDGVLVTDFGADPETVAAPIVPASAGDIGDRMILVPQQTNPDANEDELRNLLLELASERNVVVIVPSGARANYWKPHAALVLDKDNLAEGVKRLRADPAVGLVVLVNRYDGVDLPGNACHVLVIDGIPEALDGLERIDQANLAGSDALIARQVQRLEQGMGRATRSNEDHCVVLLLGARLAERLHSPTARRSFSPATRAQLDLSAAIAAELEGSSLADLRDVIDQCLNRDKAWVAASRGVLAALRYEPATVGEIAKAGRTAFDLATGREYREAVTALQSVVNTTKDVAYKGYLQQQLAAYLHYVDPAAAQQMQLAANRNNRNLLRSIDGVVYERLSASSIEQGASATAWLQNQYTTTTDLVLGMNALVADLDWGPRTKAFEQAWADLAWHLGLTGQRPERDTGRGPDCLWALPGNQFLVTEAKSGVKADHPVYKSDAQQLSNAMDWFREQYTGSTGTPLMVHPQRRFEFTAAIPTGCRVINTDKLSKLRDALTALTTALADTDAFRDPAPPTPPRIRPDSGVVSHAAHNGGAPCPPLRTTHVLV